MTLARKNCIWQAARRAVETVLPDGVAEATRKRGGEISVLAAGEDPKLIDIAAADGEQTVRIEMA